jgi:hypothetical protein
MTMPSGIRARRLDEADADAIGAVFRSRTKLMLREKNARQHALPEHFRRMLETGREAFGTFWGNNLQAFCIFSPWIDQPTSTLVLMQSRPVPGPVDLVKNGLATCLDAALASLERHGYTHTIFRRSTDAKWRPERILKNAGRLGEYHFNVAETIAAGGVSKWERINSSVLGDEPVDHDTAIVIGGRPEPR